MADGAEEEVAVLLHGFGGVEVGGGRGEAVYHTPKEAAVYTDDHAGC